MKNKETRMFKTVTKQQGSQTKLVSAIRAHMFKTVTKQQGSQTSSIGEPYC